MNIGTIKSTLDSLDLLKMKKDGVGTNIFNQRIFAKWRWQLKKFGNHWRDSTFGVSNYRIELIEATSMSRMTTTSFWKYAFLVPFSQIILVSWFFLSCLKYVAYYYLFNFIHFSVRNHGLNDQRAALKSVDFQDPLRSLFFMGITTGIMS